MKIQKTGDSNNNHSKRLKRKGHSAEGSTARVTNFLYEKKCIFLINSLKTSAALLELDSHKKPKKV